MIAENDKEPKPFIKTYLSIWFCLDHKSLTKVNHNTFRFSTNNVNAFYMNFMEIKYLQLKEGQALFWELFYDSESRCIPAAIRPLLKTTIRDQNTNTKNTGVIKWMDYFIIRLFIFISES